jgi:hypothetical protein
VRLIEVQRAGKGPMKAADFLNGSKLGPGAVASPDAALQADHRI